MKKYYSSLEQEMARTGKSMGNKAFQEAWA